MNDIIGHSKYIQDMAEKTGLSETTLKTLWKRAESEFKFLDTFNPDTYKNIKEHGAESEGISEIFEELVAKMPTADTYKPSDELEEPEKAPDEDFSDAEGIFGDELGDEFDPEGSLNDLPEDIDFGEEIEEEVGFEEEPEDIKGKIEKAESESGDSVPDEEESDDGANVDEIFSDEGDTEREPKGR